MTANDIVGWWNICPRCLCLYWVRGADAQATKARRWNGPDTNERHECRTGVAQ